MVLLLKCTVMGKGEKSTKPTGRDRLSPAPSSTLPSNLCPYSTPHEDPFMSCLVPTSLSSLSSAVSDHLAMVPLGEVSGPTQ